MKALVLTVSAQANLSAAKVKAPSAGRSQKRKPIWIVKT